MSRQDRWAPARTFRNHCEKVARTLQVASSFLHSFNTSRDFQQVHKETQILEHISICSNLSQQIPITANTFFSKLDSWCFESIRISQFHPECPEFYNSVVILPWYHGWWKVHCSMTICNGHQGEAQCTRDTRHVVSPLPALGAAVFFHETEPQAASFMEIELYLIFIDYRL